VSRPDFARTIVEFQRRFPEEEACRAYLFASRWSDGFSGPRCGGAKAGEPPKRRLGECRSCGPQASVTAGTVMHGTRTPLQLWFWAAYLVATHHPGISAVQLRRQRGIGRYDTAWLLLHKLRRAMLARERDRLTGPVEVDDFYVGGIKEGRGGGRTSDSTKAIAVAAIAPRGTGSGRLCLAVIPDLSAASLCGVVATVVDAGATVHSDGWQGYRWLSQIGYDHRRASQRQSPAGQWLLPRVHRSISNLKAWLHGTPPRRLARTPAGVPRRVRLSSQPSAHADGRLPDAARARRPAPAHHLPPEPPTRRLSRLTERTRYAGRPL
jgi:ISXO2-like transposase domain/Transposase zinc-ribbon domain